MEFDGKVVLITGAGSGIGAACALLFASKGATLSLADINEEWINRTVSNVSALISDKKKVMATVGNLTDANVRQKFVSDSLTAFGKIDILLNIAGMYMQESLLNPNLESVERTLNLNFIAPYHLSSLCAPHLIKTKGNIVNTSSTVSDIAFPNAIAYSSSKAAIDNLTKSMATELGPYQVRVNSIRPGGVYTNIVGSHSGAEVPRSEMDQTAPLHLLGRAGEPSEIAEMITYMASDKCSFMTGTNLLFDGGFNTKRQEVPMFDVKVAP